MTAHSIFGMMLILTAIVMANPRVSITASKMWIAMLMSVLLNGFPYALLIVGYLLMRGQ